MRTDSRPPSAVCSEAWAAASRNDLFVVAPARLARATASSYRCLTPASACGHDALPPARRSHGTRAGHAASAETEARGHHLGGRPLVGSTRTVPPLVRVGVQAPARRRTHRGRMPLPAPQHRDRAGTLVALDRRAAARHRHRRESLVRAEPRRLDPRRGGRVSAGARSAAGCAADVLPRDSKGRPTLRVRDRGEPGRLGAFRRGRPRQHSLRLRPERTRRSSSTATTPITLFNFKYGRPKEAFARAPARSPVPGTCAFRRWRIG